MDPSLAFDIANLLLKCSSSPIFKEIKSIWKYEEEINMLADTIDTIGSCLSRVQGIRFEADELNKGFKRLREVYLDAEDLLDKVQTLKKKKDAMNNQIKEAEAEATNPNGRRKLSLACIRIKMKPIIIKGLRLLSRSNQPKHAIKVHRAVKKIKKKLKAILEDHNLALTEPSSRSEITPTTARATGRYVDATEIIGRDEDKMKIVDLLIRSPVDDNKIPVISIVGIGGMGKTTAAQLVCKDERLQKECQFDMKLWVSDSKKYDLRSLLKHILKSISPTEASLDNLEEDHLKERLVNEIQGKRFLLVLDDVDNEDPHSWEKLEALLKNGNKGGSRILVTTRSRKVAKVVGGSLTDSTYKLDGLSKEDSLQLFERFAFQERRPENLAEIGRQIVGKCSGVPLAVKVMGSYLKDKNRSEWEFVRDNSFTDIRDEENQILPILKLSYDDLDATLRQCFQYCAIFPKNYLVQVDVLKNIWMENVRLENRGRTPEDVCDKNLTILLNRCFLDRDEYGDGKDFVMHDLMHDLAKDVAGPEIRGVDLNHEVDLDKLIAEENVRHLSLIGEGHLTVRPKGKRLRTILGYSTVPNVTWSGIASECPVLRILQMSYSKVENLPHSLGMLIHLRHLDVSGNQFQTLPNSITELINLRYLNLSDCGYLTHLPSGMGALMSLEHLELDECAKLKELPRGIEKLMKLKRFSFFECDKLDKMPSGMGPLMPVCDPPRFIVGHPVLSDHTAQLEELGSHFDLAALKIELPWNITSKVPAWYGQAFLLKKESLRQLKIEWTSRPYTEEAMNSMDSLNSEEEVSTNSMNILAKLRPPPNLEKFSLRLYQGMAFPHDFALNLSNLVSLSIKNCTRLEYIEDNAPAKPFCFPKLEKLVLQNLPELKGWYRGLAVGVNDDDKEHIQLMPSFPCLSSVTITECPIVTVSFFLSSLKMSLLSSNIAVVTDYGCLDSSMEKKDYVRLVTRRLSDNLAEPLRAISYHVRYLHIRQFQTYTIRALQHFPALRHLEITNCVEFTGEEHSVGDEIECLKSIQTLTLICLRKLVRLPDWILSLTSLHVLHIENCFNLKAGVLNFLHSKDVAGSTFRTFRVIEKEKVSRPTIPFTHALKIFGPQESINAQLKDPKHFPDECTSLQIMPFNYTWKAPVGDSDAILLNKKRLRGLQICWLCNENLEEEFRVIHIDILAKLQPPLNLTSFTLDEYQGKTFPPWAAGHGFAHALPNLVFLRIKNCRRCRYLPSMIGLECLKMLELSGLTSLKYIEESVSVAPFCLLKLEKLVLRDLPICQYLPSMNRLECLKELELSGLSSLEYIEESVSAVSFCLPKLEKLVLKDLLICGYLPSLSRLECLKELELSGLSILEYIEENVSAAPFFLPKLEKLALRRLPVLKGWCKGDIQSLLLSSFPCLSVLVISACPNLTVPPLLGFTKVSELESRVEEGLSPSIEVQIDDLVLSLSLHKDNLSLDITNFNPTESALSYMAEIFRGMSDRLMYLHLRSCLGLKTLPEILQHLSTLRGLKISKCPNFMWEEDEEEEEKPSVASEIQPISHDAHISWKGLSSLQELFLIELPNMVRLPEGIQFLTSLQDLYIYDCDNLLIPEWQHNIFPYYKVDGGGKQIHLAKKEMDGCSSSTSI